MGGPVLDSRVLSPDRWCSRDPTGPSEKGPGSRRRVNKVTSGLRRTGTPGRDQFTVVNTNFKENLSVDRRHSGNRTTYPLLSNRPWPTPTPLRGNFRIWFYYSKSRKQVTPRRLFVKTPSEVLTQQRGSRNKDPKRRREGNGRKSGGSNLPKRPHGGRRNSPESEGRIIRDDHN